MAASSASAPPSGSPSIMPTWSKSQATAVIWPLRADAVNYERVVYEGYGPNRVPVMIECLTDNVNRTAPNMRVCFCAGASCLPDRRRRAPRR